MAENYYTKEYVGTYCNQLIENNTPFSMLICDIDDFSYISDTYGAETADQVLDATRKTLEEKIANVGILGRFEDDAFVIVLPNLADYDELWKICRKACLAINKVKIKAINNSTLTMTVGASRFPTDANNFDDLFTATNKALWRGKQKGTNCFIIYLADKHSDIKIPE